MFLCVCVSVGTIGRSCKGTAKTGQTGGQMDR